MWSGQCAEFWVGAVMSFDSTCRRLAEMFPPDFATWLLGRPIAFTELSPTELSIEPIRADSLILLKGESEILHIEFQYKYKKTLPMRLADYRLRIHRKFPNHRIHQVVIYLHKTKSQKVFQNYFEIAGMYAEFEIIRIWEVPVETLMSSPGLLPFAVLGKSHNAKKSLQQAVRSMVEVSDESQQHEIMAAAYVLAGLKLDAEVVSRIIRRDIMQESVTYQAILEEGSQIGEVKGRLEVARSLLQRGFSVHDVAAIANLTLEQVQALTENL
jgi:predicted transposase/invertase (TIGR01784 family)